MNERNLFEELKQGLEEIKLHQQGKITLRTETLSKQPKVKIAPNERPQKKTKCGFM